MEDLYNFLIVFVVLVVPYSQVLLVFINLNSNEGCVTDFSSFGRSIYSVILIMQNLIDLSQLDTKKNFILIYIHITLIFMLPIILVNFLIAKMTSSVEDMMKAKPVLTDIQHLQVVLPIDSRLQIIPFFNKWEIKYYTWMKQRYYVTKGDNIYVVCVEPISSDTSYCN